MKNINAESRKIFSFADAVFLAFVLIFAVVLFCSFSESDDNALIAVISRDKEVVARFNLSDIDNSFEYTVDGDIPVTFLIGINGVSVIKSGCPDKLCEKSGAISDAHTSIVCLPAAVSVRLEECDEYEKEIDGIVK